MNAQNWVEVAAALLTLTGMEIILGIDNIIFIAVIVGRLPKERQAKTRTFGMLLALITRLLLLFSLTWLMRLTAPLVEVLGHAFSGRDLILLGGGAFLVAKATTEVHHKVTGVDGVKPAARKVDGFWLLAQIAVLDIVFSLDSVITAVGMAQEVWIMVTAMLISVAVMLFAAGPISHFVEKFPTVQILALSFLVLIGVVLVVESFGQHVGKGYIYSAMFFSLAVELINIRAGGAGRAGQKGGRSR